MSQKKPRNKSASGGAIDSDAVTRREKEISEAHEFADAILNTIRTPILILDPALNVRYANPAFYKLFQVKPAEIETKSIFALGERVFQLHGQRLAPCQQESDMHIMVDFDDITERKHLEQERVEAADAEQRRIGQELHDGIGQELTRLGLLADAA